MTDLNLGLLPNKREIGELTLAGRNTFFGTNKQFGASTPSKIADADRGQVLLISKVIVPNTSIRTVDTPLVAAAFQAVSLVDPGGTPRFILPFLMYNRDSGFGAAGPLRATPDRTIVWEPQMPLMVPSRWKLTVDSISDNGKGVGVFGIRVGDSDARTLGYDVANPSAAQDTGGVLNYRWIQTGSACPTSGNITLAPAITGKAILITDIVVRMQANVGAATVILEDSTGVDIKVFRATNIGDLREWVLKPRIYLVGGRGLRINVSANAVDHASIIVLGRYVDTADVPDNAWWAHIDVTAGLPTPGGTASTLGFRSVGVLKAAPGKGYQHILEGYSIDVSKDSTAPSAFRQLIGAITTSAAAGLSLIEVAGTTQNMMSPGVPFSGADQDVSLNVDQVNIPAIPNTGAILWEMDTIDPTAGDADIDAMSVLAWGRTVHGDDKNAASNITWLKGTGAS